MLKRENLVIHHKRTRHIYREDAYPQKKEPQKGCDWRQSRHIGRWKAKPDVDMDFVADSPITGRRFRALTIIDNYTRECPAIEMVTSLGGWRVIEVLEKLEETRGLPEVITVDNGPEFAGKMLDEWAYRKGSNLNFIHPWKPVEMPSQRVSTAD